MSDHTMPPKIACLILANSGAQVLSRSLVVYLAAGWDVYVHLDAKRSRDAYTAQLGAAGDKVRFVDDPVKVYWAGFSMIEAELKLIGLARSTGDYDKYLLLSDDTLPLFPAEALNVVLRQDQDFITAVRQGKGSKNDKLFAKYIFPDHDVTTLRPGATQTAEFDERLEAAALEIAALRRIGKKPVDLYYGSQFWALTRDSIETILAVVAEDRHLVLSFRYSSFSDEMFFHSILCREKHKGGIASGPVYADFYTDVGKTRTYREAYELPYDLHPTHLFVRKVDPDAQAFLNEALARLSAGRTVYGISPASLHRTVSQRASFRSLGSVTTARLAAPALDEEAGSTWSGPGRYLQRLYRWSTREQLRWTIIVPPVPAGRLRCFLPVVMAMPGFLERSTLTALGQTKTLIDTRYSLIAEFTHDGIGGEIEIVLDTPAPVVADPHRDPRLLGLGVAIDEPASVLEPSGMVPAAPRIDPAPRAACLSLRSEMEEYLAGFAGHPVLFYPNPGNAGDSLIAAGEYAAFARAGIPFQLVDFGSDVTGGTVLLGGGGNLVPMYASTRLAFERFLGKAARIILLPHTVRGHDDLLRRLDDTCTIFCRDPLSHAHVTANAPRAVVRLAHDMAFHVDPEELLADEDIAATAAPKFAERLARANLTAAALAEKEVVNYLRRDGESAGHDLTIDADPSDLFDFGVGPEQAQMASWCLLSAIALAKSVRTDRLHVGIGAAMLGKTCTLMDNSYGKNAGIFAHSLAGRFPALQMASAAPEPQPQGGETI